jgi:hypothetical protein
MKKKDRRYNSPIDNYTRKYNDNFKVMLIYILIGGIGYGLYKLYQYLF